MWNKGDLGLFADLRPLQNAAHNKNMFRVPASSPYGTLQEHGGNVESPGFSWLNLNEQQATLNLS